ncbi:hypothetical protein BMG05_10400 [Mycobacterium malmoense]|nr:hypothetical protein BMG05_10400 [Mycobacterium malmoense]
MQTGHSLPGEVRRSATISADGQYRWSLYRGWDHGPVMCWVMLNPSTADGRHDDPTIRRCMGFARSWGYGAMSVVNLYALRATNPKALWQHHDPVGAKNDAELAFAAQTFPLIVMAWGAHGRQPRVAEATRILHRCYEHGAQLAALGWTKNGNPRHPLYVRGDTRPQPWYGEELAHG